MCTLTKKQKYRAASEKGLRYLLSTQKDNGGWRGWDVDAVTFNDDVTTGTLELFRNILQGDSSFLWLDSGMLIQYNRSHTIRACRSTEKHNMYRMVLKRHGHNNMTTKPLFP